jgi:release factor glutamine methyltransferase
VAPTLRARLAQTTWRLNLAGIPGDEARLDAELLLREALGGWDRARLLAHDDETLPAVAADKLEGMVARRAAREPMAYVLGRAEFWGLEFEVTPDVLIPRPETELLVERVIQLVPGARHGVGPGEAPLQIVDIGTGSGCIAIALALELPGARFAATDTSAAALAVARRNARRHGVVHRIAFLEAAFCGDAYDCDLIVSNPPYVPERDREALQPEVRDNEPASALFAGQDGLAVIRQLVDRAWHDLGVGSGWLVFEFGAGQADAVRALLDATPALARVRGASVRDELERLARAAGWGELAGLDECAAEIERTLHGIDPADDRSGEEESLVGVAELLERDHVVGVHRPWADLEIIGDLQGIPRVAVARKQPWPRA